MPKNFDLKGPAFVGLQVRDVQASAGFYEKTLGLRRDPAVFPNGAVAFLPYPIPFRLTYLPPGVDWKTFPARPRLLVSGSKRLTARRSTTPWSRQESPS